MKRRRFPVTALDRLSYAYQYAPFVGSSLIHPQELQFLNEVVPSSGLFVEIGTCCGVTIAHLATHHPATTFVSVDPHSNLKWGEVTLVRAHENYRRTQAGNLVLITGTSRQLPLMIRPRSVDGVFIDGDHSYAGCSFDLRLADRLLLPSGVLLVHDYNKPNHAYVVNAVDDFLSEGVWAIRAQRMRMVLLRRV